MEQVRRFVIVNMRIKSHASDIILISKGRLGDEAQSDYTDSR